MKNLKRSLFLIIACGVVMAGCQKGPEQKAEYAVKKITKKLDLNESQEAKLREIKTMALETRKKYSEEKKEALSKVIDLINSEKLDEGVVRDLIERRRKVMESEFPRFFPKVQELHATLDSSQKEKLTSFIEKMQKKFLP